MKKVNLVFVSVVICAFLSFALFLGGCSDSDGTLYCEIYSPLKQHSDSIMLVCIGEPNKSYGNLDYIATLRHVGGTSSHSGNWNHVLKFNLEYDKDIINVVPDSGYLIAQGKRVGKTEVYIDGIRYVTVFSFEKIHDYLRVVDRDTPGSEPPYYAEAEVSGNIVFQLIQSASSEYRYAYVETPDINLYSNSFAARIVALENVTQYVRVFPGDWIVRTSDIFRLPDEFKDELLLETEKVWRITTQNKQ